VFQCLSNALTVDMEYQAGICPGTRIYRELATNARKS
jgi:hypothetical protein